MKTAGILHSLPAVCAHLRRSALTPVHAKVRRRRDLCSSTVSDDAAAAVTASDGAADLHLIQSILSGIMAPYWGECRSA